MSKDGKVISEAKISSVKKEVSKKKKEIKKIVKK